MTNIYHFSVPNTHITYTIKLTYEDSFIRMVEVTNLIWKARSVSENELPKDELELYMNHLSNKINNISIVKNSQ